MTSAFDRARAYVQKCPPAVSGQSGHNQTFSVASALTNGFALPEDQAWLLLQEYNASCSPPWSERELRHKLSEAIAKPHDKPRGHLLAARGAFDPAASYGDTPRALPAPAPPASATPQAGSASPTQPVKYDLADAQELPEAVDDGCRALLREVFRSGEGVRIVNAKLDDEQKEVPDGQGPCLTREEWLKKLDKVDGDPNGIFKSSRKTGLYVCVNPLKPGAIKDEDVTDFRHALVEFDEKLSPEEQFRLYQVSRLPCSAVIFSGGKSVHAWVKIDARDRREYDERVKVLYEHFQAAGLPLDVKNKNPSRLSRLPNCVRFNSRQELLALGMGCQSWTEWLKHLAGEQLGKCYRLSDLIDLDTTHDPNCVLGFRDGLTLRWLCRGKSAWLIGPSGIGKSSLNTEFAIGWALGRPVFGIEPSRALRSLIIQAENDVYDLAEMVQGIAKAHGLDPELAAETFAAVNRNVVLKTESSCIGQDFCDRLHRLIDREKPDLVWVDPLLSFAGIDVSRQQEVSQFLRQWIGPVMESTGVVLIGTHHTGKPKSQRETQNWTALDYAYSGIGSSELVNWARAVMVMRPVTEGAFELKLAKRGIRAGATHPDGTWTTSVWLKHSQSGIRWEQTQPPEEPAEQECQKSGKKGRPSQSEELAFSNIHDLLASIPAQGESKSDLGRRLYNYARKNGFDISEQTCRKGLIALLTKTGKIAFNEKTESYSRGSNA